MAIGDTVQAGLGRMDFSAFQKAGAAQAQANQAFGKAIEKAAIGFFQGQEKKKKKQEMVQGLTMLFPDAPPELVNAMAKNPEVTQAKLNLDRFNLEVDKFNKDAEVSDQQVAMMNQAMQNTQADRLLAEQNRKDTENFYNFMGKPTYPVDQDGIPSPFPSPPPVEQFVVSEQAKAFIQRAIEQGQPIDKALPMAQQIDQQIERNQPKPMSPKELADYESKLIANETDRIKLNDLKNPPAPPAPPEPVYEEATLQGINDALGLINGFSTGVMGLALSKIPGTDALDLRAALDTVTSGVGFKRLSDMREASKTGGALGNVSEKELKQLNASLGSIDPNQKPETLKRNLIRIKEQYEKTIKIINAERIAFQQGLEFKTEKEAMDFIDQQNLQSSSAPASQSILDEIERKKQLRSKRAGL